MEHNCIQVKTICKFILLLLAIMLQKVFAAVSIDVPVVITVVWALSFILLIVCYCISKKMFIPIQYGLCQLWIAGMLCMALLIAPAIVEYTFKLKRIAYEFVYYEVLFFYLLVGYNISRINCGHYFLRCISYSATAVASIAVFTELFNIDLFRKLFYLSGAGIRFSGLVGNPNDYMPITFVALAYFFITKKEKQSTKIIASAILLFSVLASGSKGGLVSLFLYVLIGLSKQSLAYNRNRRLLAVTCLGILMGGVLITLIFHESLSSFLLQLGSVIPGMERIANALKDPWRAIGDSGSLRLECWYGAYLIIIHSLLLGVGIGGHGRILETLQYEYSYLTPHNVYLELLAQSGIIIAFVIFVSCFGMLRKSMKNKNEEVKILRHAMYLLLLNGLYFATNWSVAFWFVAGMLCYGANHTGE